MVPVKVLNPKQGIEITIHNPSSHADVKGMDLCLAKPRLPVEQSIFYKYNIMNRIE